MKREMIKTNSMFLVCITLLFILPVNFSYAQENISQESASIRKKELNNPIVDTGQVKCYNNSREIFYPKARLHGEAGRQDLKCTYIENESPISPNK